MIIPSSVCYIGEGAFRKNELRYIELHDKLTYIGSEAFMYNLFSKENIPRLPRPNIQGKIFLYWQSFKKGKYNIMTKSFETIMVSKQQPGDKIDFNLGYKAVFKEDL